VTDTVRVRVLRALTALLASVERGQPPDDPYPIDFSSIGLGPIGDPDMRKELVGGVVPGRETTVTLYPFVQATLPVVVEFRRVVQSGSGSSEEQGEEVLGVVQRRLRENPPLDGLAQDMVEVASEVTLDFVADRTVEGFLEVNVIYRRSVDDPREDQ